jgi:lipoprotein-releasing system ATP-binding protein
MNEKRPVLQLQNITKTYKQGNTSIEILKDISLDVFPKEMIAIVGASGSGKSTLLHIAGLLDKCDEGKVIYRHCEEARRHRRGNPELRATKWIAALRSAHRAAMTIRTNDRIRLQSIGFIYQYHHLLRDFNARENVALPALIAGVSYKKALIKADEFLDNLGLSKKLYNMPGELSGGERQRVAIARSLINNPQVILADEPTGNLDPHTANEVFNIFLKVAKDYNAAIIMVTHNHALAAKMDRTYELKDGKLGSYIFKT